MTGTTIVTTVTEAISQTATGIAETVVDTFNTVFVTEGGLSNLAIWGLVFLGVGFAIGLVRKFVGKAG